MNTETRRLLTRWQSLRDGKGVERATSVARGLWLAGLALFLFVVFGIYFSLPVVAVTVAAAVMGWVIAESNALRLRIAQWATVASYIDWSRVSDDLAGNQQDD